MSRIKQLIVDIAESRCEEDDDIKYAFPDHPIVPTKVAVFDDSELEKDNDEQG